MLNMKERSDKKLVSNYVNEHESEFNQSRSHTQGDVLPLHSAFGFQRRQLVRHEVLLVEQSHEALLEVTHVGLSLVPVGENC